MVERAPIPSIRRRADIVFKESRVAVFVDGCFWHSCPRHRTLPKANKAWWDEKLAVNQTRDRDTDARFRREGWTVVRVWEHEDMREAAERVKKRLVGRPSRRTGTGSLEAGRASLRDVVALLEQAATESRFVPSYARMNPAANLGKNVFHFATSNGRSRVVLFGPWLYVRANDFELPRGMEVVDPERRRRRHLGALSGRVLATDPANMPAIRKLVKAIIRRNRPSQKS